MDLHEGVHLRIITLKFLGYVSSTVNLDVPIIGLAIGNGLYRLVFSYRLSDWLVYEISSRSDIIGGQLQVY